MKKDRINEIWGVLFLLLGLFTLASLVFFHSADIAFYTSHPSNPVENVTGIIGAYLAFGLFITFGISAYVIPLLFLLWSSCFFLQQVPQKKFFKFLGLAMALFSAATIVAISVQESAQFSYGGAIGYLAGSHLLKYFGHLGSYIVAGSCLLLSLLLATDFLLYPILKKFSSRANKVISEILGALKYGYEEIADILDSLKVDKDNEGSQKSPRRLKKAKNVKQPAALPQTAIKVKKYDPSVSEMAEKLKAEAAAKAQIKASPDKAPKPKKIKFEDDKSSDLAPAGEGEKFEGVIGSSGKRQSNYQLPPISLLKRPLASKNSPDDFESNSRILEKTLSDFGISVKVTEVEQGPVITRYELLPAPGVKVNSIAALSDDIALALKARSVRLIIPIPGKSAIGVEVPNAVSNVVSLCEMVDSKAFHARKETLPLVLGKTANGTPLIVDLTKMPHILIAGSTGSGKTVCVNSIIMGLLYHYTPDDLKFVMVDPKMVELACYNTIPHMLTPVVTDVRKASHSLNWVVNEMENRYKLFATCGVRNIQTFNSRPISEENLKETEGIESENVVPAKLPYIVVVIDELADLMLVARDKVEGIILRLAQLARAVGIHLILATQRPSVDVITGVIKANFPARLSFKVSSKVDSRTVLDTSGADKLLGRGDMLFMQPGDPKPVRGQAPLVSDDEINAVVKFVASQSAPEYHPEILRAQEGRAGGGAVEKDELFAEAVQVVLETRQASTSNLQRRLRLGYTRAARIIDQMEAEGIIGPQQGARPREILVSSDETETVENL